MQPYGLILRTLLITTPWAPCDGKPVAAIAQDQAVQKQVLKQMEQCPPVVDESGSVQDQIDQVNGLIGQACQRQQNFQKEATRAAREARRLAVDTPDIVESRQLYQIADVYQAMAAEQQLLIYELEERRNALLQRLKP